MHDTRIRNRRQQIADLRTISERLADMDEAINVAGSEDETSTELKWILPKLLLACAGGFCAFAIGSVVSAEKVKNVGLVQFSRLVRLPLVIDQ